MIKKKLCFISSNIHKKEEIETFFQNEGYKIEVLLPNEIIDIERKIVEDGESFYENAIIKVRTYIDISYKLPVFAEDSGLCIKALNYRPGIYSARYGGEKLSYKEKCKLILKELGDEKDREAYFISVMALSYKGKIYCVEGRSYGKIAYNIKEGYGFGYDPIFIGENGKRFSELTQAEKNQISHRGRALKNLLKLLYNIGLLS
jgi:XTP/dITP diphosphohydrolase